MKKLLFLSVAGLMSIAAIAQESDKEEKDEQQVNVPVVVTEAFIKDFPDATDVSWGAEGREFEAEFKLNGVDCSANYDKTGHRTQFESLIKQEELPQSVLEYVKQKYPDYTLMEAAKIINDKNNVMYEAEVGLNGKSFDLIFNADGNFLRKKYD